MKYLEIIDMIAKRDLDWECVHDIVNDALEDLKRYDKGFYDKTIAELEDYAYTIERPEAEKIVRAMKPYGEFWSYDDIRSFVATKGIVDDITQWYMVMNMVYNDFFPTAREFGHDGDAEFYYSLAKSYMDDVDAMPHKVERYFMVES